MTARRIFQPDDERPLYRKLAEVEDKLGSTEAEYIRRLLWAYGQDQRAVGYRDAQKRVVAYVPDPYEDTLEPSG